MIYVRRRLLYGMKEMHREPETVVGQPAQIVGRGVNLLGRDTKAFRPVSDPGVQTNSMIESHTFPSQSKSS